MGRVGVRLPRDNPLSHQGGVRGRSPGENPLRPFSREREEEDGLSGEAQGPGGWGSPTLCAEPSPL